MDYCIFGGETNHPVRERCSYKAMDRQVRELTIYQFGTPVPSECEALRTKCILSATDHPIHVFTLYFHYCSTPHRIYYQGTKQEQSLASTTQWQNHRFHFGDDVHHRKHSDSLINTLRGIVVPLLRQKQWYRV